MSKHVFTHRFSSFKELGEFMGVKPKPAPVKRKVRLPLGTGDGKTAAANIAG